MSCRVCPWWLGYFLLSPFRRWELNPEELLRPYLWEGMTVLEPGPGMGFFTLPLARMVGPTGKIVAVDIQQKMLKALKRRAAKAGLQERIDLRLAHQDSMMLDDLTNAVDFVMAFATVHEMPSAETFFREVAAVLKPGGQLLLVEPAGHVNDEKFAAEVQAAKSAGLTVEGIPTIRKSHAARLKK